MDPLAGIFNYSGRNMLNLGLPYAQDQGNELGALAVPQIQMIKPINDLPSMPAQARIQSPEAEQGKMVTIATEPEGSPVTGKEGVRPIGPVPGPAPLSPPPDLSPAGLEVWKRNVAGDKAGRLGEAPKASDKPTPGVGTFNTALSRTLEFEGGLNPADTNGTPTNFGINQAAHPEIDVTKLTPVQAAGIYKKDYWDAIGADKLPAPLAHVAFDSAVLAGPGKVKEWISASGGDPGKFMELREGYLNGLLKSDPTKYGKYAGAWASRDATLLGDIGLGGEAKPLKAFVEGGGTEGGEGGSQVASTPATPASTSAPASGPKGLKDLMNLAMIQQMFSQHVFTPVTYDPFKNMPKLEVGQNG